MYLDVFSLSVPPQSIELRGQSLQTVDGYLNLNSPGFILSTGYSRRLLDLISVKFRLVSGVDLEVQFWLIVLGGSIVEIRVWCLLEAK